MQRMLKLQLRSLVKTVLISFMQSKDLALYANDIMYVSVQFSIMCIYPSLHTIIQNTKLVIYIKVTDDRVHRLCMDVETATQIFR